MKHFYIKVLGEVFGVSGTVINAFLFQISFSLSWASSEASLGFNQLGHNLLWHSHMVPHHDTGCLCSTAAGCPEGSHVPQLHVILLWDPDEWTPAERSPETWPESEKKQQASVQQNTVFMLSQNILNIWLTVISLLAHECDFDRRKVVKLLCSSE